MQALAKSTKHSVEDVYLGTTAEGEHVYASVTAELHEGRLTTVEHEQLKSAWDLSVSWMVIEPFSGFNPRNPYANSRRTDRHLSSIGQTSPEDRIIAKPAIDTDDLALIEQMWADWHLNTLIAGCAHMPDRAELDRMTPADQPEPHGRGQAITYWAIDNIVCEETGYRYGSSWLVRVAPQDVVDAVLRLIARYSA